MSGDPALLCSEAEAVEQFFRHVFFDLGGDGLVDFSASTGEAESKVVDGEWVPWPFVDDAFGGIVRPVYVPRGGCCVLFFYVFPGVVGLVGVIATCCFEAPLWNTCTCRPTCTCTTGSY